MKPRRLLAVLAAVVPLAALAACGSSRARSSTTGAPAAGGVASSSVASSSAISSPQSSAISSPPCGPAAAETLAGVVGLVARRIYENEISSSEVTKDKRQVEAFAPLLGALASGNRGAIKQSVESLVYSHTHIVRLRITRGATVLADVGGPQILAPVGGPLRGHGRTLGHYVLSVQDDLGYVKLVTRFIGTPLVLHRGPQALRIEGAVSPGPASIPDHGPVSYRGRTYQAFSFGGQAFPSGPLRISLLVPVPAAASNMGCEQIKVQELGVVAQRISRRFKLGPSDFSSYISATAPLTSGLLYVRAGAHQLAGSTHPGPAHLPAQGTVRYRGTTYGVASFTTNSSIGQVRVYQLVGP